MKRPRPIVPHPTDPSAALVELTRGYWATIDAADAKAVGARNWCAVTPNGRVYACSKIDRTFRYLHQFIAERAGIAGGPTVDHVDGNRLDNRRQNLRAATQGQQVRNTRIGKNNTSGVKGVTWNASVQKWMAQIQVNRRHVYLGVFVSIAEAAACIAVARLRLHGEFANHGVH